MTREDMDIHDLKTLDAMLAFIARSVEYRKERTRDSVVVSTYNGALDYISDMRSEISAVLRGLEAARDAEENAAEAAAEAKHDRQLMSDFYASR